MLSEKEIAKITSIKWCLEEMSDWVSALEEDDDEGDARIVAWHHAEIIHEMMGMIYRGEYDKVADLYKTYRKSIHAAWKYFAEGHKNEHQ